MEKLFHPCALIAKKRYVGYAWENAKQESPIFDDKGIETVRRDSCPIVSETLRESIKLLFEDRYDRFNLKRFLMQKFSVILNGNIAINKYLFAKEVRLGTYSNSGLPPPAAIVSQRNMLKDPRSEPLHAQRVQYLVVYGIPGSRLADLVVSPDEYFSDSTLQVNGSYYIKKQIIPAISRVLELAGVDINLWFSQLPKSHINFTRPRKVLNKAGSVSKSSYTLDQFFQSSRCKNCGAVKAKSKLCEECSADPVGSSIQWTSKQYYSDLSYGKLIRICSACTAKTTKSNRVEWKVPCTSFDCPVLFFKHKADDNLQETFLLELF
jgi:DNA polymerase zeta